jgi:hypothetical protein
MTVLQLIGEMTPTEHCSSHMHSRLSEDEAVNVAKLLAASQGLEVPLNRRRDLGALVRTSMYTSRDMNRCRIGTASYIEVKLTTSTKRAHDAILQECLSKGITGVDYVASLSKTSSIARGKKAGANAPILGMTTEEAIRALTGHHPQEVSTVMTNTNTSAGECAVSDGRSENLYDVYANPESPSTEVLAQGQRDKRDEQEMWPQPSTTE